MKRESAKRKALEMVSISGSETAWRTKTAAKSGGMVWRKAWRNVSVASMRRQQNVKRQSGEMAKTSSENRRRLRN